MKKTLSPAIEDYLKTIYKLSAEPNETGKGGVSKQILATRMGVAAPSVTAMVKKLTSLKLARHTPYYGVELTEAGEKIALEVIRHHRLVETYLNEVLGLDWDKVHDEAERWEHVLSEEVEAKMAAALNHPTHDPHGAPIPTLDGHIAQDEWARLSAMPAGVRVVVRRVSDENPDVLRHLGEIGLVPNTEVEVLRAVPSEGVLQLMIGNKHCIIGSAPAHAVFVSDLK